MFQFYSFHLKTDQSFLFFESFCRFSECSLENNVFELFKLAVETGYKETDWRILGEFQSQLTDLFTAMVNASECGLLLADKISVW